jgi:hypothetical protein
VNPAIAATSLNGSRVKATVRQTSHAQTRDVVTDRPASISAGASSNVAVERYYGRGVANAAAYNVEYRRTARPQSVNDV